MTEITKAELKALKKEFRKGTRVILIKMNDPYAPPTGTMGTVNYVGDTGVLGIKWDNGLKLNVLYGQDIVGIVV